MGKRCANCQPSGVQELGESPVQEHEVISLNNLDQPMLKAINLVVSLLISFPTCGTQAN